MAIVSRDGVDGKVCSTCGEWRPLAHFSRQSDKPDGYRSQCKPCLRTANRAYKDANRDAVNARKLAWSKTEQGRAQRQAWRNTPEAREQERAYNQQYRQAHADEIRDRKRAYNQANRDRVLETHRNWIARNRERMREWFRKFRERHGHHYYQNKEKYRSYFHRRRARLAGNGGSHTAEEWEALKAFYNYTCLCCGRTEPDISLTVDHVIPVTRGGSDDITNLQPLCEKCNKSKHDKAIDYRPKRE